MRSRLLACPRHGSNPAIGRALSVPPRLGGTRAVEGTLACVGPTTPKHFGAKHQTRPHVAVHGPPDSTREMGAAEMGATIRSPVVGDPPE